MKVPWRIGEILSLLSASFSLLNGATTDVEHDQNKITDTCTAHSFSREPLNYVSIVDNATIQTPSHRVHSFSNFDLHFNIHKNPQRLRFTLLPNQDIIADGASVQYLGKDGEPVRSEPIDRHAHKIFKGETWLQSPNGHWTNVGWARIMVKRDGLHPLFEGAFTVVRDHHHVQLRSHYMSTKHELDPAAEDTGDEYMTVFRDSDIGRRPQLEHIDLKRSDVFERSCRSNELKYNSNPSQTGLKRDVGFWGAAPIGSLFGKRQIDTNGIPTGGNSGAANLKSTIGQTNGCPSSRKVALIGVATDCAYTSSFNSSETARSNVIQQIASASTLYEKTFNVTLGLQNLTISDASCPRHASSGNTMESGV